MPTQLNPSAGVHELAREYQRGVVRASMRATTRAASWSPRDIVAELEADDARACFSKGLLIVNMGALDLDGPEHAMPSELSDFWVFRNCNAGQHSMAVTLTELEGRLGLSFCYPQPLTSRASAEAVAMRVIRALEKLTPGARAELVA